jgi:cysteine desulfurase
MDKVYLDNASTTPIDPAVLEAMMPYLLTNFGNASSLHSFGKPNKVIVEDTRDLVAEYLGVMPREIYFTSGGTESNNFALKGIALNFLNSRQNHIITSSMEHMAVLETCEYLKTKFGFNVTFLNPDKEGRITADSVKEHIKESTFLISVMHSNNETGVINDLKGIANAVPENKVLVHTDSIQSIGKTAFKPKELNVNTATLSAHKIYGPKGVSVLYIKKNMPIDKFMHGGSQERDMRGGTENIAAIAGLKKAIELLKEREEHDIKHYESLKARTVQKLKENFGGLILFNSNETHSLPNIVNISFDSSRNTFDPETLLIKLDLEGIAVSGGSACTSGSLKPSHVITALGRDEKTALASLRISFGRQNTLEDIDRFIDVLKRVVLA